jgi:hypothetical protein
MENNKATKTATIPVTNTALLRYLERYLKWAEVDSSKVRDEARRVASEWKGF